MPIMKMLSRIAFSACVVSALAASAVAQGPGGRGGAGGPGGGRMGMGMGMGGGASGLLMMKEVREELKLDEDQVKELEDMGKAMQESMQSMRPQPGQQPDPAAMQANMEKIRKAMAESEAKLEEMRLAKESYERSRIAERLREESQLKRRQEILQQQRLHQKIATVSV